MVIGVLVCLTACSSNKEKKDTSELWSKAMTTGEIIKRSGTKLTSEGQRASGVTEADAKNRLISGGGLLGNKPISLTGGTKDKQVAGIGMPINPYLWRASLEAVSFMPLSSADPFGGIIITDWYSNGQNIDERCKINIFIKGLELKTSNLKVGSFCQSFKNNKWVDLPVNASSNVQLENAILNKAKKIKLAKN